MNGQSASESPIFGKILDLSSAAFTTSKAKCKIKLIASSTIIY
jgi:hypothetical protein